MADQSLRVHDGLTSTCLVMHDISYRIEYRDSEVVSWHILRDNYPSKKIDIPHNSNQQCCRQHVALNAVGNNDKGSLATCCWKSRLTPAVLCWKARPLGTAAFCRVATGLRHAARLAVRSPLPRVSSILAHFILRLYIAVVCDNLRIFHTAKHLRIVSYRIVSRYFV